MINLRSPIRYESLSLANFRGFKSTDQIQLAPLTFLVGPNSSGKSSLVDSLLLVAQSGVGDLRTFRPKWSGPFVDLGSFMDTVYRHKESLKIRISFTVTLPSYIFDPDTQYRRDSAERNEPIPFEVRVQLRGSEDNPTGEVFLIGFRDLSTDRELVIRNYASGKLQLDPPIALPDITEESPLEGPWPHSLTNELKRNLQDNWEELGPDLLGGVRRIVTLIEDQPLSYFTGRVQRVASGRRAPERWYPRDAAAGNQQTIYGGGLFNSVYPGMITPQGLPGRDSMTDTLSALEIADDITSHELSRYHTSINVRDAITKVEVNLKDVGYGASQAIPVIAACQSEQYEPLFVEQPEIHLHPKAQGAVAELLARTSERRQVFVETHSVHMINRARLMVASGEFSPSHVTILYVDRDPDGSHVVPINLTERGEFRRKWPSGFFDERYQDTMRLLKIKESNSRDQS